jgi:hypothetical protein
MDIQNSSSTQVKLTYKEYLNKYFPEKIFEPELAPGDIVDDLVKNAQSKLQAIAKEFFASISQ